jgi:hypothetical protein
VKKAQLDEGLRLDTREALLAKQTAQRIFQWYEETADCLTSQYTEYLKSIFGLWSSVPPVNGHIREEIWTRFSHFVSSNEYVVFWSALHLAAGTDQVSDNLTSVITFNMFIHHWMTTYPLTSLVACMRQYQAIS